MTGFGALFTIVAIISDTAFFGSTTAKSTLDALHHSPIITPLNNVIYNSNSANLALHGLHSRYQHFLVNLPELLGPAYIAIVISFFLRRWPSLTVPPWLNNMRFYSAISGTAILSIFPHQEARFLIPTVPLLLSCINPPRSRLVLAIWMVFNAAMGCLMGIYHQGGIIPTQLAIPSIAMQTETTRLSMAESSPNYTTATAKVFWWKTYPPPTWLIGDPTITISDDHSLQIETLDLMGISGQKMLEEVDKTIPSCSTSGIDTTANGDGNGEDIFILLVAPKSTTFLDQYINHNYHNHHHQQEGKGEGEKEGNNDNQYNLNNIQLHEKYTYKNHINLDDLDFGDDGILPTLKRVVGRRGLTVWSVTRTGCTT